MRKITLFIITCICISMSAQTNSTGVISLSASLGYTAEIDVTSTQVTLTLVGPSNGWLGLGFGVSCMTSGGTDDVVIYDGTNLTDRNYIGIGVVPALDTATQDWTISSDTTMGSVRTLIATRAADTGDPQDYVFDVSDTSISLVWAHRVGSFDIESHGGNRGATTSGFTLSNTTFQEDTKFSIVPNPSKDNLNVILPSLLNEDLTIEVYNVLGKRIHKSTLTGLKSTINITNWKSGMYLVRVSNDKITQTKRFIKQ